MVGATRPDQGQSHVGARGSIDPQLFGGKKLYEKISENL